MLRLSRKWSSTIDSNGNLKSSNGDDHVHRIVDAHLIRGQVPAALSALREQLPTTSQKTLEKCVWLFGRHGKWDRSSMVEAFKMMLEKGYSPSASLWTRLIQVAAVKGTDLEELSKHMTMPSMTDEKSVVALMRFHAKCRRPEVVEKLFGQYQQVLKSDKPGIFPGPYVWKALVDARGIVGDLKGAKGWFHIWRTSRAHPYGFMEDDGGTFSQRLGHAEKKTKSLFQNTSPLFMFPRMPLGTVSLLQKPRSAHTLSEIPAPSSLPYIALLNHISEQTNKGNHSSWQLIELMASDRVPLDTRVMNALMQHELHRDEARVTESILALYEIMKSSSKIEMQPNEVTFTKVFKSYREPKRTNTGRKHNEALPTRLARQAELNSPKPELLANSRFVIFDFLARQPRLIGTSKLMDDALASCVNVRDFIGANIVVQLYKILSIEPSARTHAIVVHGSLRAWQREEAFLDSSAKLWLTPECCNAMLQRVSQLNELVGFQPYAPAEVITIRPVPHNRTSLSPSNQYLVSRPPPTETPELWNNRIVARRPWELRATRKFELRDTAYLHELLRRASPHGAQRHAWLAELDRATREICPPEWKHRMDLTKVINSSEQLKLNVL